MAKSVVSFVLERLDFLIDEAKFIHGVDRQVLEIYDELRWMKAFLQDADAKQAEDERICEWVRDVRNLAYDAGDVLESFLLRVESERGGGIMNILKRYLCIFLCECLVRHEVGTEIVDIKSRITELNSRKDTYGIRSLPEASSSTQGRLSQLRRTYSHSVENDFVGLQGDVEDLVGHLVKDGDDCYSLVSICGLGGLGKTTIARKVYNHEKVKRHFEAFAWVCISQTWQPTDILQQILIKLIPNEKKEIKELGYDEMIKKLFEIQKAKRCLVVLDDIWKKDAWDCLKEAFPKENTTSKLLLTSRNKNVAISVSSDGFHYEPRGLTDDEAWMLLKKKAFSKNIRHHSDLEEVNEMENLGIEMVRQCKGLPLAVIVLGGILVNKQRVVDWKNVRRNIKPLIRLGESRGQEHGGVSEILELSYTDLPYHLKSCFLYLSKFKEDSEIDTVELYQLWMAESMVLSEGKGEDETMMEVAESYLSELAQRSMVQVQLEECESEFKKYESCRMHDMVRELCLSKAKEEDFFSTIEIKQKNNHEDDGSSSHSNSNVTARRVVIYFQDEVTSSRVVNLNTKTSQRLRSLSLFYEPARYEGCLPSMVKSHLNDFKFLRVLAIVGSLPDQWEDTSFKSSKTMLRDHFKLPNAIGSLVHLRYMSLEYTPFAIFPSSIKNLKQLQTLILTGSQSKMLDQGMENVLGEMSQLQNLYLPNKVECMPNGSKLQLEGLINLEVLVNFDPSWCQIEDFNQLINLRKFTAIVSSNQLKETNKIISYLKSTNSKYIRQASIRIEVNGLLSEELQTILMQLLGSSCVHELEFIGSLGMKLPGYNNSSTLPSRFTTLYLMYSKLEEDPMPILEALPNLRILVMSDAFEGTEMVCSSHGFLQLTTLTLAYMNNLQKLKVENGAFPRLSNLEFYGCGHLKMIPDGLIFITSLKTLTSYGMPEEFTEKVRAVRDGEKGEDFDKIGHIPSIIIDVL